jgi:hypothetical protein
VAGEGAGLSGTRYSGNFFLDQSGSFLVISLLEASWNNEKLLSLDPNLQI